MRFCFSLRLGVAILSLMLTAILLAVLEDKCQTYDPISFVKASMPWSSQADNDLTTHGAGIIVVPAMDKDNVSWIAEELPDWEYAIYYVEHPNAGEQADRLTTPANKGNEAMAYLSYIIDHYEQPIPAVVAFLHSHRDGFFRAWHVDTPLHDNVNAMQNLQLDYVLKNGYVNLRCNHNPGCTKPWKGNPHVTGQLWWEIFENTSTPFFDSDPNGPAAVSVTSSAVNQSGEDQLRIWTPCCAQFAVSATQIYQRPLDDYVNIRQWLLETELDNAHSGRVMEYLWHIIFGKAASYCPDPEACYCDVYGRC